jgi:hypothetical protein
VAAQSYPSEFKQDGYASRHVADAMCEALVTDTELLTIVDEDMNDGDGDFRRANSAIRTLYLRLVYEYDTQTKVAAGDYRAAKKAVKKLAPNDDSTK